MMLQWFWIFLIIIASLAFIWGAIYVLIEINNVPMRNALHDAVERDRLRRKQLNLDTIRHYHKMINFILDEERISIVKNLAIEESDKSLLKKIETIEEFLAWKKSSENQTINNSKDFFEK